MQLFLNKENENENPLRLVDAGDFYFRADRLFLTLLATYERPYLASYSFAALGFVVELIWRGADWLRW